MLRLKDHGGGSVAGPSTWHSNTHMPPTQTSYLPRIAYLSHRFYFHITPSETYGGKRVHKSLQHIPKMQIFICLGERNCAF
jgi:hypothetical protein